MSKLLYPLLATFIILTNAIFPFQIAFAAAPPSCSQNGITVTPTNAPVTSPYTLKNNFDANNSIGVVITFSPDAISKLTPDWNYDLSFIKNGMLLNPWPRTTTNFIGKDITLARPSVTLTLDGGPLGSIGNYVLEFRSFSPTLGGEVTRVSVCTGPSLNIQPEDFSTTECKLSLPPNIEYKQPYTVTSPNLSITPTNKNYKVMILNGKILQSKFKPPFYMADYERFRTEATYTQIIDKPATPSINIPGLEISSNYTLVILPDPGARGDIENISWGCAVGYFQVSRDATKPPQPIAIPAPSAPITNQPCNPDPLSANPCARAGGQQIKNCTDNKGNPGIATAIGCIHTSPPELAQDLLKFIIGIGGGLTFLMMLLGAYQMLTSDGNPESLKAGQDRLTSAVIGLLFIIFSVLFLQIMGAGILNIPGFK